MTLMFLKNSKNNIFNSYRIPLSLTVLFFFLNCIIALSQEGQDLGTEVVNIVKPYTPTISDAFKVKETPVLNDSITTAKKEVKYNIFSVPVASTFTPAKGKAATVEKAEPMTLYDSYATLGFGNYTSALAELYSNFQISRTDNAGFFLRHNSSQGDIDDVILENKFYHTTLDGNYSSRQKDLSYGAEAGLQHEFYNWYGLNDFFRDPMPGIIESIDPGQNYFSAYVGGNVSMEDTFFEGGRARIRYLGDSYSSSEFNLFANPGFTFPITDLTLKVDTELDFLNGKFDRDYFNNGPIDYSFLNLGVTPSLVFVNEDLTVSLGAGVYFSFDTENSQTDFFLYPRINASYRLVDEVLIAYGGVDGGLVQNSYYEFKEENPFVSPTLWVAPTSQLYNGFAGLKGKVSNTVGYNVRASYGEERDKALFQANAYKGMSVNFEGYENGNSFGIVYGDVTTLDLFGELKVEVSNDFSLGITGNYRSYDTSGQAEAWNLPELEASLFANFNITEKVYGGASLFFVGERKDLFINTTTPLADPTIVTLDSYFDANLHFGYRVNDRLNIFLKGSNLVGENYQKWFNFPVQGIQALLGATYKFDW